MNVVDSSGWLEYLTGAANADFFASAILDSSQLIVPTISVYEVFKILLLRYSQGEALDMLNSMFRGRIVPLDENLSISAARLSIELRLPMADSIILANGTNIRRDLMDAGCGLRADCGCAVC